MKAERSANTIFFFVRGSEKRTRANLEAHLSTICFARFHHCGKCYAHLGAYIYCKQAVKHTLFTKGPMSQGAHPNSSQFYDIHLKVSQRKE